MSAESKAGSGDRIISESELNKHNTERDCWIAVNGVVYDVTSFLVDHPGGPDTIVEVAGKDATEGFEDVGHSSSARTQLAKYKIGVLAGQEGGKASKASAALPKKEVAGEAGGSLLSYLVPAAILAGAVWYQFVYLPQQAAQK